MPCTKEECDMENQIGCKDYESQAAEVMKTVSVDGLNYKFEEVK